MKILTSQAEILLIKDAALAVFVKLELYLRCMHHSMECSQGIISHHHTLLGNDVQTRIKCGPNITEKNTKMRFNVSRLVADLLFTGPPCFLWLCYKPHSHAISTFVET